MATKIAEDRDAGSVRAFPGSLHPVRLQSARNRTEYLLCSLLTPNRSTSAPLTLGRGRRLPPRDRARDGHALGRQLGQDILLGVVGAPLTNGAVGENCAADSARAHVYTWGLRREGSPTSHPRPRAYSTMPRCNVAWLVALCLLHIDK